MTIDRRRFIAGSAAFAAAGMSYTMPANAQVISRTETFDLGAQGALYRIPLDFGEGRRFLCTAAVLPRRSFSAAIVSHGPAGAINAVKDVALQTRAAVAINGGRFNGAFAPDGLLMIDGRTIGEKRADWIGYLEIDAAGNATVTDTPHLHLARGALQGNPMLVEPGGKMGIIREDGRRFRRTVIAQSGDLIIAMVTSPVSLFTLAYALIERPDLFFLNHVDAALNLSGAATTSFYAKLADGEEINVRAYWPNRDVVAFVPRMV